MTDRLSPIRCRVDRRAVLYAPLLMLAGAGAERLEAVVPGEDFADTEWRHYAGDLASSRHADLGQIDAANFNTLEIAWRFRTDALGPRPEYNLQGTPLLIKGTLYATAGSRRDVVALDAGTGELLWMHRIDEGARAERSPRKLSGHGVAYWDDGGDGRILYVTIGYQLISLNARTGQRTSDFGIDGIVDLRRDFDQEIDPVTADVGLHSTPCIVNGVAIVGAAHSSGRAPHTFDNVRGYVRGFDVRTGHRLWTFHTIPKAGEYGHDSWTDGTDHIGNAGVWCQISADPALNLAYLGVELPTGDTVGRYRRGAGLFGESIVAVDVTTGRRRWHFQTVHHGLWDSDIPCAPVLCDITVGGRRVKALAQASKQSLLYVLDRETGEPVWPISEMAVPGGAMPGESYSRTQPIPSRPPAYDVNGIDEDTLIDFTPELRAEAVRLTRNYAVGPLFTPPSLFDPKGTWGTLVTSATGGTNWPGGSYDPVSQILYVYSKREADVLVNLPNNAPDRSDFAYVNVDRPPVRVAGEVIERDGFRPGTLTVQGLPLLKPPYGRISAIDLRQGRILWQIAHGETPDEIRHHPLLKGKAIARTGRAGIVGPLTTRSLLICGEPGLATLPSGRRGAMLRAYDKLSGWEVGAVEMPAPQTGSPMSYMHRGRQYIVVAVSGGGATGEYIAYRLPL